MVWKKKPPENETQSVSHPSLLLGVFFPAIYLAILSTFCMVYSVIPGPEFVVLCFFIYAAYNKWTRRFMTDWAPFLGVFLSYEAMNGIVGKFSTVIHVVEPAALELRLFGSFPTLILQQSFRSPFLDYLGAFFYSVHFIAPTVFGFVLWKYYPGNFRKYALAIAVATYSALVTFLVFPVAPPWYGINAPRILLQVDNSLGIPFYRTIFDLVQSNPFAAFPSLHSTYPWLISLFALKIGRKKALPILAFPVGVWFSAVYLGEHYVIDVIGGIIYATCAFLLVERIIPLIMRHFRNHV